MRVGTWWGPRVLWSDPNLVISLCQVVGGVAAVLQHRSCKAVAFSVQCGLFLLVPVGVGAMFDSDNFLSVMVFGRCRFGSDSASFLSWVVVWWLAWSRVEFATALMSQFNQMLLSWVRVELSGCVDVSIQPTGVVGVCYCVQSIRFILLFIITGSCLVRFFKNYINKHFYYLWEGIRNSEYAMSTN